MADSNIINARVNSYLKERVDYVLRREQTTASELIRSVWEEVARSGDLPDFAKQQSQEDRHNAQLEKIRVLHSAIGSSNLPSEIANQDIKEFLLDHVAERYG